METKDKMIITILISILVMIFIFAIQEGEKYMKTDIASMKEDIIKIHKLLDDIEFEIEEEGILIRELQGFFKEIKSYNTSGNFYYPKDKKREGYYKHNPRLKKNSQHP